MGLVQEQKVGNYYSKYFGLWKYAYNFTKHMHAVLLWPFGKYFPIFISFPGEYYLRFKEAQSHMLSNRMETQPQVFLTLGSMCSMYGGHPCV